MIVRVLELFFFRRPNEEEWKQIAVIFLEKRNRPNCVETFDENHFDIKVPVHLRNVYFNHKRRFIIVLLAACNASYVFTFVRV